MSIETKEQLGLIERMISAAADVVEANWEHLSRLDQAIGDGDHGANLRRGFAALAQKSARIAELPFDEGVKMGGMTLIASIGGASGPLLGSMLMAFGSAGPRMPETLPEVAAMLRAGVEAVKARGKSDVGAKTMIDVLEPVTAFVEAGGGVTPAALASVAHRSATATIGMVATKGRAAFLGERSRGHKDPGAASAALIIEAVCRQVRTAA